MKGSEPFVHAFDFDRILMRQFSGFQIEGRLGCHNQNSLMSMIGGQTLFD